LVCCAALALALAWVIRIGFPELGETRIPQGQSASFSGMELRLERLSPVESLPPGFEGGDPNLPVPGAVYLVAEFSLAGDPEPNSSCWAYLAGEGRGWNETFQSLPSGFYQRCGDAPSGQVTKVFEVPKRALGEVGGVWISFSKTDGEPEAEVQAADRVFFEAAGPLG
jgi:hypothetical protein